VYSGLGRPKKKKKKKKKKKENGSSNGASRRRTESEDPLAWWRKLKMKIKSSSKSGDHAETLRLLRIAHEETVSVEILSEVGIGKTINKLSKRCGNSEVVNQCNHVVQQWKRQARAEKKTKKKEEEPNGATVDEEGAGESQG
jgi:hypothetical protein